MAISEPTLPLDAEAARRLAWSVGTFQEPTSLDRENERRLTQEASWNPMAGRLLAESQARRDKARREYAEGLETLRRHADDPSVIEYFRTELESDDHLKRRAAVRLLGALGRRDWVVAALTDVAQRDPFMARRSTSSIEYTDPDVAEMYMETYYELREEAEATLRRLG